MAWLGHTNEKIFKTVDAPVDIPLDDKAAWKLYPNHNWVYSTSRLLEMQNIEWSPYYRLPLSWAVNEFSMWNSSPFEIQEIDGPPVNSPGGMAHGKIFMAPIDGEKLTTVVAVLKGEIKWAAHHIDDPGVSDRKIVLADLRGDVELRISALTTLHFRKFAGVITVDSIGHDIIGVKLRMTPEVVSQYPEDWLKRVIRIYSRRPWGK